MSIKNIDVIDLVPVEAAAIATADAYFADVPVVVMERGNVAAELARLQAAITSKGGKRGISVVALQMTGDDEFPEVRFGPLRLHFAFQVIENVELNNDANGTKKSARKVARKLIQIFKATRLDGLTTDWECDKPALEPLALTKDGKLLANLVGYQVGFNFAEADDEAIEQVAAPLFADSNGQAFESGGSLGAGLGLVITSATAGAEIWYTTDGSIPMPGTTNPSSTAKVYTDAIEVPNDAEVFRAAAFKAGLIGSTVSRVKLV
jgi:hypothetical protein